MRWQSSSYEYGTKHSKEKTASAATGAVSTVKQILKLLLV
nr:MAG TPA: hypothetical protein [Caudoviricetes sp.]DAT43228.1 MAG TPA: hypothetical protein [Caudoviricetes sp.]